VGYGKHRLMTCSIKGRVTWVGIVGGGINAFLISFLARVRGRELGIVRSQMTGALQRQSTSGSSTSGVHCKKRFCHFPVPIRDVTN
jgi:hypothetical protein